MLIDGFKNHYFRGNFEEIDSHDLSLIAFELSHHEIVVYSFIIEALITVNGNVKENRKELQIALLTDLFTS